MHYEPEKKEIVFVVVGFKIFKISIYIIITNIIIISVVFELLKLSLLKNQPNTRNISTQHLATLLRVTCCTRLATL